MGLALLIENLTGAILTNSDLIAAPGTGKRIVLHSLMVTVDAASEIIVSEGANGDGVRIVDMYAPANGGILFQAMPAGPRTLPANTALKVSTTAGNVKAVALYAIEG